MAAGAAEPSRRGLQEEVRRVLEDYRLEQREQMERLLLKQEQRLLESLGSCIAEHCRDACQEAARAARVEGFPCHAAAALPATPHDYRSGEEGGGREGGGVVKDQSMGYRGTGGYSFVDEAKLRETLGKGATSQFFTQTVSGKAPAKTQRKRDILRKIIHNRKFDSIMTGLICLNALLIGIQVDWSVKHRNADAVSPLYFRVLDLFFACIFSTELLARLLSDGVLFFSRKNNRFIWNMTDMFLVMVVAFDEVTQHMNESSFGKMDVSSAKLLRVLRLARIVRVLRLVRAFRDLEIMVLGIIGSMRSLLWAMVLLSMIVFMFATIVMEFVSKDTLVTEDEALVVLSQYGSLFQSFFTLFKAISGGVDWEVAADPLVAISPLLGLCFCAYVGFSLFCVLNIITAVFVENARLLAERDEEELVMRVVEARQQRMEDVNRLFRHVNPENGGALDLQKLQEHIADVCVQGCFARLGLGLDEQSLLLEWVAAQHPEDSGGSLSVKEFTQCVGMFQANASRADVDRLLYENSQMQRQLQDLCGLVFSQQQSSCCLAPFEAPAELLKEPRLQAGKLEEAETEAGENSSPSTSDGPDRVSARRSRELYAARNARDSSSASVPVEGRPKFAMGLPARCNSTPCESPLAMEQEARHRQASAWRTSLISKVVEEGQEAEAGKDAFDGSPGLPWVPHHA